MSQERMERKRLCSMWR